MLVRECCRGITMNMRDVLERNARRWSMQLTRFVYANFVMVGDVDGVISDAFFEVFEKIDGIEERFSAGIAGGIRGTRTEFLYGCLRLSAKRLCLGYMASTRVRRGVALNDTGEFDENVTDWRPTATVQPEQERVVFFKQMMEHCHALPPEEAVIMALTLDRATAEEIVNELGLSHGELIRRRARAIKSLMARELA